MSANNAKSEQARRKEIGWIHAGKSKLGLDDETYKAMLEKITGKRSAADLTGPERQAVLKYINDQTKPGGRPDRRWQAAPAQDRAALWSKIDALLFSMGKTRSYLDGKIKTRIAQVDAWEFANAATLQKVVAALSLQQQRAKK